MGKLGVEHHVKFPDGVKRTDISDTRRPLMLVRGKPITVEQAMQLITGEEPLFKKVSECERSECGRFRDPREFIIS